MGKIDTLGQRQDIENHGAYTQCVESKRVRRQCLNALRAIDNHKIQGIAKSTQNCETYSREVKSNFT